MNLDVAEGLLRPDVPLARNHFHVALSQLPGGRAGLAFVERDELVEVAAIEEDFGIGWRRGLRRVARTGSDSRGPGTAGIVDAPLRAGVRRRVVIPEPMILLGIEGADEGADDKERSESGL